MSTEPVAVIPRSQHEDLRISLGTHRGRRILNMRVWATSRRDGQTYPTKDGFALRPAQIRPLIEALQQAEQQAVSMGWLK